MTNQTTRSKRSSWLTALVIIAILILVSISVPQVRASLSAFLGLSVAPSDEVPATPATLIAVASPAQVEKTPAATTLPTSAQQTMEVSLPVVSTGKPVDLSQVSNLVDWNILSPGWLPEGYKFQSAYFDPSQKLLYLTYLVQRALPGSSDPSLTTTKTITLLQALKNDFVPMQVAPGTNVADIQVNGLPAAYALGAWDTEFVKDDNAPGGGKLVSTWRNDLQVKNIYWQNGEVYLVLLTDDEALTQQDLIELAASTGE